MRNSRLPESVTGKTAPKKKPDARSEEPAKAPAPRVSHEEKKKADAEARKRARAEHARRSRIETLEARIAETEQAIRELEQTMGAPGFYDDRTAAQPLIERHQALMWQVGDLMHQWEELQSLSELAPASDR